MNSGLAMPNNAVETLWVLAIGIATVFTLVLIPVIYSLLAPLAPPRAHAGIRLDRELRDMELRAIVPFEKAAE